jgi:uncharacterized protein DUF6160
MKTTYKITHIALLSMAASTAFALKPMNDTQMSSISGQDGFSIDAETALTVDSMALTLDPSTANEAVLDFGSSNNGAPMPIGLMNVDENGVASGNAFVNQDIDVGTNAGNPYIHYQLEIVGQDDGDGGRRARLMMGELSHGGANTYGTWVLDGEGRFELINRSGLFNVSATDAYMLGELKNSRIFYRQLDGNDANRAYMIMDNLQARWEMEAGTFGINSEGIRMATTDTIDVALDFDIYHKTGGADFTPGGRGLMHFGWLGSLKDPELLWRTKGAAGASTPGALNLSSRWNFIGASDPEAIADPSKEFRWRLGETGGTASPVNGDTRVQFETADWATWGGHPYGHDFPLIALDVINSTGSRLADMSLCWGATIASGCSGGQSAVLTPGFIGTTGGNEGLAIWTRDGSFQAYSRKINLIEEVYNGVTGEYEMQLLADTGNRYYSPNVSRAVNWGLIYTFANIDGNIFIHPGGNPDGTTNGITADLMLVSQTFDGTGSQGFNWDEGSHLMIADTDMDDDGITGETRDAQGIGLLSTSFLLMADDTRIWLKPEETGYALGSDNFSGGIDLFSPRSRFALSTTFGGGVLPDDGGGYGAGPRFVTGSIITANLEGAVNMRLSPSAASDLPGSTNGGNYLGYSWALRLIPTLSNDAGATGFGSSPYGSHISLAEPSRPSVAIRLANISGDMAVVEGRVDVRPGFEDGDDKPKMIISHTVQLGNAAAARMNEVQGMPTTTAPEFRIDNLMLGDATLGRIVMPSAQIYSSITLQPQY